MIKNLFLSIVFIFLISSCSLIQTQQGTDDHKWRTRKFDKPVYLEIIYQPEVIFDKYKSEVTPFFAVPYASKIDSHYKIKELLLARFEKRKIISDEKRSTKLSIDSLIFETFSEKTTLESLRREILTNDFFIFEIKGTIVKDSVTKNINVIFQYSSIPEECPSFPNYFSKDRIRPSAPKRMLKKAINLFTYRAYKELEKLE